MTELHQVPVCRCRALSLSSVPVALTCGFFEGVIIADPAADEEPLLSATVTTVLDESGKLLGTRSTDRASSLSLFTGLFNGVDSAGLWIWKSSCILRAEQSSHVLPGEPASKPHAVASGAQACTSPVACS